MPTLPSSTGRPIALTCGESAGIGPDLCLIVAQRARDYPLVCLADRSLLEERARALGLRCQFSDYREQLAPERAAGMLSVLHLPLATRAICGQLDRRNAHATLQLIDRAVDGCRSGEFAAMVTAPVQKSVIIDAGFAFSGHTEYIAARCHVPQAVMLLIAGRLRVALAT
ncbi:MAG TPA: 4-hydroxythreonine-4-phosphate dehydrogenase PdxA, partial [Steroidobacteraceae bacterium]